MTNEEQNAMIMGWIGEMEAAGLSYDSMLEVFRLARVLVEASYSGNKLVKKVAVA